jgi:hypothetical protein
MAHLDIQRMRFRVTGRGWVRGEAAARVARAAERRLPAAVAARLAELWPDEERVVDEPLRLTLRVRLAELAAAIDSDEALTALVARLVDRTLADARAALAGEEAPRAAASTEAAAETARDAPFAWSLEPAGGRAALMALLVDWQARGWLEALLGGMPAAALARWCEVLQGETAPDAAAPSSAAEARGAEAEAARSKAEAERAARARAQLLAMVKAAARDETVAQAEDESFTPAAERATAPPTRPSQLRHFAASTVEPARPRDAPPPPLIAHHAAPVERTGEREIACALPFLLLRSLERIGWLEALAACFAAFERSDALPAVATGLAYKVLAPPARGWRRDDATQAVAEVFAGALCDDAALAAVDAPELLAPLDAVVARALVAGHAPGAPLLIAGQGADRLLLESDGLFPIAAGDAESLLRGLAGCAAKLVVFADAAEPSLLRALDGAGHCFFTDAPPARGERWRRLQRGRRILYTNGSGEGAALAVDQLDGADEAGALLAALRARPAVATEACASLERTLALAAGAALGDLSWRLFRAREPSTPRLALERFADLGARVCWDDTTMEVRLPLGRRARDLQSHSLLGETRAPWLGRRTIRLVGG